jgi:TonB-dependent SusC/RagA subfamily outer membrane receptor
MKARFFLPALLLMIFLYPATAQKASNKKYLISGYITDANNNPVQGAMILIDKKNSQVLSDARGYYKIKIKSGSKVVSAFSLKNGTGDAEIGDKTEINIKLNGSQMSQSAKPEEEKVDIGYGNINRKEATTQVSKVKGNEDKYASYSNIYDMLRGTCPGIQVIGKEIHIQGQDFHNGNPLFVVDGVIVGSIDDIQPVQVKSIEVLKGASASIYGSRGAAGVLLIHLKGTSGK